MDVGIVRERKHEQYPIFITFHTSFPQYLGQKKKKKTYYISSSRLTADQMLGPPWRPTSSVHSF